MDYNMYVCGIYLPTCYLCISTRIARIGSSQKCYVCDGEGCDNVSNMGTTDCQITTTPSTGGTTPSTGGTTPSTVATTPSTEATTPSTEATTPSTEATTPSTEATTPSTEATTPSTEATTPSTEATTPSTEATTPSTEATTPSTEATTPSTEATTPSTEATTLSTEATTPSTEATTPTTEATTPSTEATTPSTEATTPATEAKPNVLMLDFRRRLLQTNPTWVCVKVSYKENDVTKIKRGCYEKKDESEEKEATCKTFLNNDAKVVQQCDVCNDKDGCNPASILKISWPLLMIVLIPTLLLGVVS